MSTFRQSVTRFAVWSNVFYVTPFVVAAYLGLWVGALVIVALICASTAFHLSRERRYTISDMVASICAIAVCGGLIYLGDLRSLQLVTISVLAGLGLYVRYFAEKGDRGSIAHGWWHVIAATTLTACLLAYAGLI